jgi:hypothetical protein
MKKVLTLSLAIMMVASAAMADSFGIFADAAGTDGNCELVPPAFSPFSVYVVHDSPLGATGSQFKVVNTSGYALSAAVQGGFLAIGDAFVDLALAYGSCRVGKTSVVALSGFGFPVPGQTCGVVETTPAPGKPAIIAVDCGLLELPATTGKLVFNANPTCPCIPTVATEESTWGKVKSLYR